MKITKFEKIQAFTAKYRDKLPRAVCVCKHTGDGANSDHMSEVVSLGHGPCKKCKCPQFTWKKFTVAYQAAIDKIK